MNDNLQNNELLSALMEIAKNHGYIVENDFIAKGYDSPELNPENLSIIYATGESINNRISDVHNEIVSIQNRINEMNEKIKSVGGTDIKSTQSLYRMSLRMEAFRHRFNSSTDIESKFREKLFKKDNVDQLSEEYKILKNEIEQLEYMLEKNKRINDIYIKYAQDNDIEIVNKESLENDSINNQNIEVDTKKVDSIVRYISGVLNRYGVSNLNGFESLLTEEIIKKYSTIMSEEKCELHELDTVKEILDKESILHDHVEYLKRALNISIDEECISVFSGRRYIYASPEYIKQEYKYVMEDMNDFESFDIITKSSEFFEAIKRYRGGIENYIKENEIEGIDTKQFQGTINYDMLNSIADFSSEACKPEFNKDEIRMKISSWLEANWSKIMESSSLALQFDEIGYIKMRINEKFCFCYGITKDSGAKCVYATSEELQHRKNIMDNVLKEEEIPDYMYEFYLDYKKALDEYIPKDQELSQEMVSSEQSIVTENESKKSLKELEEELANLEITEQQAKELLEQYKEQLRKKSNQEI